MLYLFKKKILLASAVSDLPGYLTRAALLAEVEFLNF